MLDCMYFALQKEKLQFIIEWVVQYEVPSCSGVWAY